MASFELPRKDSCVVHTRDLAGAPVAVEIVTAPHWDDAYLALPDAEAADARLVRLSDVGGAPDAVDLPGWLRVEHVPSRVAQTAASYADAESLVWSGGASGRAAADIEAFIVAAATALVAPIPAPTEPLACLEVVRHEVVRHGGMAAGMLAPLIDLDGPALERWLVRRFRTPEWLAGELLIARMEADGATEQAAALRFLRDAEVDEGAVAYLDLAFDRRALLEQASPWRYFEASDFGAAIAALRPWQARYRRAYASHYAAVIEAARGVEAELDLGVRAAASLRRLNRVCSLGAAVGAVALHDLEVTRAALAALAPQPDPERARTSDVTLGAMPACFDDARRAVAAVRAALEVQRQRLAAQLAHLVLDREEVPALDRLLQAITASELGGIERVLDDRLVGHIEALLAS